MATDPGAEGVRAAPPEVEPLVRANRAVAHDLRNVFSVINACAVDLYDEMHGRQAAGLVLEILNAAERGLLAATELMQAGSGGVEGARPVDLGRQLHDLEPILRRLASPGVALHVATPAVPLWAAIDRTSLMQVLMNLVANASDAMGRQGRILVGCDRRVRSGVDGRRAEVVAVSVRDSGPGLSLDVQARMFDDGFSTKSGSHWGLGLSVVRRVVERCHGWIEVSSIPGSGTTVEVQFPLAVPERSGVALVVVAEEQARRWFTEGLAALGLSVLATCDPLEACDLVGARPIADIAVLDAVAAADRGLRHIARLDLVGAPIVLDPGRPASPAEVAHLLHQVVDADTLSGLAG